MRFPFYAFSIYAAIRRNANPRITRLYQLIARASHIIRIIVGDPSAIECDSEKEDICGWNGELQGAETGRCKEVGSTVRRRRCSGWSAEPSEMTLKVLYSVCYIFTLFFCPPPNSKLCCSFCQHRLSYGEPFVKLPATDWTSGVRFLTESRLH